MTLIIPIKTTLIKLPHPKSLLVPKQVKKKIKSKGAHKETNSLDLEIQRMLKSILT